MPLRENRTIGDLYAQTYKKPSEVLGISHERPQDMYVPPHCCKKCGHCPEEAEESAEEPSSSPVGISDDRIFESSIPVNVMGLQHFYDIVEADKVRLPFRVNIDYADWGINGISAHPVGKITVHAKCVKYGQGETEDTVVHKDFTVDLDKIQVFYDAAETIKPSELILYIGPDHEVLYKRSHVVFHFISVGL